MKYIDLSHKIDKNMPVYPGDIEVSLSQFRKLEVHKYNAFSISTGLHAGTHIDCPMHLLPNDKTIAQYPLESFSGQGYLIDARGETKIDYINKYDSEIQKNDIVLIYTGMDKFYGNATYYENHPIITENLAQFFVQKQINILGMDMPSPDLPPFPIHKLLLDNEIFILENLTNLGELLNITNFEVFAQPLKILAEASLTRAFARCP